MIEIVSCTKLAGTEFWNRSPLGQSLQRLQSSQSFLATVATENSEPLAKAYNARIHSADQADIIAFIHDDVWIDDYFFFQRLREGLTQFDVIGVAGNRRRLPQQPSWAFQVAPGTPLQVTWDQPEFLSGAVAHGPQPFGPISWYGPSGSECKLLDGVLLAARKDCLLQGNVSFDPRFAFHFYDLDFCRQVESAGLRLGTWPVAITHTSGGRMLTPEWTAQYLLYLQKWGS